ncbi:hypothetical protein WICMUC_000184 [Wickerhamomyces mucosus]|uniref:Guanine nucleotide-binding protein subunit beta n=1 Tax=Wickerhamomyces mucosus TaxID=1378264 RepID=A0A9P8PYC1_9ASCO|nr:hypothetical protein WICMUC_000184 [Wickerhamomyces mucosus]
MDIQYQRSPSHLNEFDNGIQEAITNQINKARYETKQLYNQIDKIKTKIQDTTLTDCSKNTKSLTPSHINLKTFQILKGHNNKIADMKWSSDSKTILSCSQDGFLIIWDTITGFKLNAIPLDSQWVLSCAYSPNGKLVASAGLTNNCTIYSMGSNIDDQRILTIFKGHTCGITQCDFLNNEKILTASGDMTCKLWDLNKGSKIGEFLDHFGDVLSMNINNQSNNYDNGNYNTFVTGSSDGYTRVFDIRLQERSNLVQNFFVSNSDVTSVNFFKDGNSIVTGSDDGIIRLYDLRSDCELSKYSLQSSLNEFQSKKFNQTAFFPSQSPKISNFTDTSNSSNSNNNNNNINIINSTNFYNNRYSIPSLNDQNSQLDSSGVTSLDFSSSGRLMYSCYSDYGCIIWDFLKNELVGKLEGHNNRITKVSSSPNGYGVCTSSWDSTMRLWTPAFI